MSSVNSSALSSPRSLNSFALTTPRSLNSSALTTPRSSSGRQLTREEISRMRQQVDDQNKRLQGISQRMLSMRLNLCDTGQDSARSSLENHEDIERRKILDLVQDEKRQIEQERSLRRDLPLDVEPPIRDTREHMWLTRITMLGLIGLVVLSLKR